MVTLQNDFREFQQKELCFGYKQVITYSQSIYNPKYP